MLTDEKRKKLLAGVLAAVVLANITGCMFSEDKEAAAKEEKKDDDDGTPVYNRHGFFDGFFPWFFIGRTFGVGPAANAYNNGRQGTRTTPSGQTKQEHNATSGTNQAAQKNNNTDTAGNSSVKNGSPNTVSQKSTLGSTGTAGKSGIGSGAGRSSGSAIS